MTIQRHCLTFFHAKKKILLTLTVFDPEPIGWFSVSMISRRDGFDLRQLYSIQQYKDIDV